MTMSPETIEACTRAATRYGVPVATLLGVVEQESNGVIYADVDGKKEPVVRHEGHYLYARLQGELRDRAVAAGLASPKAGGIPNPPAQETRWHRLILPAMELDEYAEIESVSWGVGQVMGANWKKLGFNSPGAFLSFVRSGVDGQIDVMMRFCVANDLIDELRRGDFAGFTRGYNGPGNVASYSTSMRRKVEEWEKKFPTTVIDAPLPSSALRMGDAGNRVRELQELLNRAGIPVTLDGDFGPATKAAVIKFQSQKFDPPGVVGPATMQALRE